MLYKGVSYYFEKVNNVTIHTEILADIFVRGAGEDWDQTKPVYSPYSRSQTVEA